MSVTIYDKTGKIKAEVSPNDSSTQSCQIQGDNVLTLSFTHFRHIELDVDDYADFMGERYRLTERYLPRQNARQEWVYDLKLYGVESMIKRLLVIKSVDGEESPVFTLTAPPREHVALIVGCMNRGMATGDWKVGQVDGTENIVIDYFGKYCDQALKEIAEKTGAEWWTEGQTVNVCRCEHGEPLTLGYCKGLTSIVPDTADNVKFYTRLYPVGSSRNIDPEKYGFSRLQLPGGLKYVEVNAERYGRVDHYEAEAFADIYPRRTGTVSGVRREVRKSEDGKDFAVWYFSDKDLPFDPNDYMLGGKVMRVSFQEGSELAGLGSEADGTYYFEVNFDSRTREFEIITIWPYDNDIQLPGETLVPKAGDRYILWNLRMPDEYYTLAEEEFLAAVNEYNAEHALDVSVYKAPTDHVWIENHGVELTVGQRVRLESREYFPETGFRDSRITRITRKVNLLSQMDIEISDALSRTSQQRLSDGISDVRSYAQSIARSVSLPDIIRTGDATKPTDNNLFSARRTQRDCLSRRQDDTAAGHITFERGMTAKDVTRHQAGARFGAYVEGRAGAAVDAAGNGEFESLTSRSFLKVWELIYNRLNAHEGNTSFADTGTVESAVANADGSVTAVMRRRWEGDFTAFQPGDVVYGYVNNLDNDGAREYYKAWAWVRAVDRAANRLTLAVYPDAEVPAGRNRPMTGGMVITRWGNNIEPNEVTAANRDYASFIVRRAGGYVNLRQRSFYISCDDGNIVELAGVRRPILERGNYGTVLGRIPAGLLPPETEELVASDQPYLYARGVVVQDLIRVNWQGAVRAEANYRGEWSAETAASETDYYRHDTGSYDTVTWQGALWQCVASRSRREPSDSNPSWLRMTGDSGEGQRRWKIEPSAPSVVWRKTLTHDPARLTCRVRLRTDMGEREFTSAYELAREGVRLEFLAEQWWKPYTAGSGGTLTLEDGTALTLEDGTAIELADGGIDLEAELDPRSSGVEFRLVDNDTVTGADIDIPAGSELATAMVPQIAEGTDGRDGKDGADGLPGREGLLLFPAGVYDSHTEYTSTGETCPVVLYNGIYYRLKVGKTFCANGNRKVNPALDSLLAGGSWVRFDTFDSVFARVVMADFGRLASAVFYGDWMISQQGRLVADDGTVSESTDGAGVSQFPAGKFLPNIALNFATGAGTFAGEIQTRFTEIGASVSAGRTAYSAAAGTYTVKDDLKLMHRGSSIKIALPRDERYVGARVTLCNVGAQFVTTGDDCRVTVTVTGGRRIYGNVTVNKGAGLSASAVGFESGVAEFIGIPSWTGAIDPDTGKTERYCDWLLVSTAAVKVRFTD